MQTRLQTNDWQATRTNLSPATRLRDEASVRYHMIRELGNVPIGQIQPAHVSGQRGNSTTLSPTGVAFIPRDHNRNVRA